MKNSIVLLVIVSLLFDSCSKDNMDKGSPQFQSLKVGYHFDDFSTGKAIDFSSTYVGVNVKNQKNNAVPSNLKLVDGKYGKALSFYDSKSALNIPYGFGVFSNEFVIDFWISLDSQPTSEYRNIINETMAGSASTFRIGVEDNYISFDFVKNPTITKGVISTIKLNKNEWYHIAFIYNGSEIKMFINGDLNASNSLLMGAMDSWNYLNMGYLGDYYGQALTFYGSIDELRVWDYKFKDEDVKKYLMITYQF